MHTLIRKLNHKNITLDSDTADTGEQVGILTTGKPYFARWLGFIGRQEARRLNGKPVKLAIAQVDKVDLAEGEYVQGCLVSDGVYAVLDTYVAVRTNDNVLPAKPPS